MTKTRTVQLLSDWINARTGELSIEQRVALTLFAEHVDRTTAVEPSASMLLAEVERIRLLLIADGWTPPEGKAQ